MPVERPASRLPLTRPDDAEIADAKRYLDLCRQMGDKLKIALAESVLNHHLDRYHAYRTSQRRKGNGMAHD